MHPTPIRKPNRAVRIALPLADWPEEDRARWARAIAPGALFGERGLAAKWRPATRRRTIDAYSRWLGELARREPSALNLSTLERVTLERIRRFCCTLSESNTWVSIASHLRAIRDALRVMAPEVEWVWLLNIAKQIDYQATPRPKADRIKTSVEIRRLGIELITRAEETSTDRFPRKVAALDYRDGLMLALLAHAPLRRSNLAGLEVGRTLLKNGAQWRILIPSEETKSKRPEDHLLPLDLSGLIDRYIERFRPALPGSGRHTGFWASAKSCALPADGAYQAIARRTLVAYGFEINPHLFRDGLMTTWALENPDQIRAASLLLGHASPKTGERHYNQAKSITASRLYSSVLARRTRQVRS